MSWKTKVKVSDVLEYGRLEATCKKCGRSAYIQLASIKNQNLYLDEVEQRTRCREKWCRGQARIALLSTHKLTPFIGGLA